MDADEENTTKKNCLRGKNENKCCPAPEITYLNKVKLCRCMFARSLSQSQSRMTFCLSRPIIHSQTAHWPRQTAASRSIEGNDDLQTFAWAIYQTAPFTTQNHKRITPSQTQSCGELGLAASLIRMIEFPQRRQLIDGPIIHY